ncbi:hypothetical protein E2C01_039666 [Portunus trituberculatus]|uniref:Uncharacterized protein n=1 Tax=Portunus trituberculatus TaxID=210409 RepID=A0A5B7FEE5_PORTR|nr:hypothetical protein [Portunus trituberculatus]
MQSHGVTNKRNENEGPIRGAQFPKDTSTTSEGTRAMGYSWIITYKVLRLISLEYYQHALMDVPGGFNGLLRYSDKKDAQ